jgi:hypothetical protein
MNEWEIQFRQMLDERKKQRDADKSTKEAMRMKAELVRLYVGTVPTSPNSEIDVHSMFAWYVLLIESYELDFIEGRISAAVDAAMISMSMNLPVPEWAASVWLKEYRKIAEGGQKCWSPELIEFWPEGIHASGRKKKALMMFGPLDVAISEIVETLKAKGVYVPRAGGADHRRKLRGVDGDRSIYSEAAGIFNKRFPGSLGRKYLTAEDVEQLVDPEGFARRRRKK